MSERETSPSPGIYFETKDGDWEYCGWDQPEHDTALVFYIHRESQGRLEMVLGGFSGRATRLLSRTLASRAEEFWPPIYSRHGIQVGAFIVKYSFSTDEHVPDLLQTDLVAEHHDHSARPRRHRSSTGQWSK